MQNHVFRDNEENCKLRQNRNCPPVKYDCIGCLNDSSQLHSTYMACNMPFYIGAIPTEACCQGGALSAYASTEIKMCVNNVREKKHLKLRFLTVQLNEALFMLHTYHIQTISEAFRVDILSG